MQMGLDDNSAIIVRSTIELGHSLGLTVTAEGVEDRATYDTLQRLGCRPRPGLLPLSRPLSARGHGGVAQRAPPDRLRADGRAAPGPAGADPVIIPVMGLLAVLSPALAGGRLRRLADVRFRHTWIVLAALVAQVVAISVMPGANHTVLSGVHLATYVAAGRVRLAEPDGPRAAGSSPRVPPATVSPSRSTAGRCPRRRRRWSAAGVHLTPGEFLNSGVLEHPRLGFLGDVFAIPEGLPAVQRLLGRRRRHRPRRRLGRPPDLPLAPGPGLDAGGPACPAAGWAPCADRPQHRPADRERTCRRLSPRAQAPTGVPPISSGRRRLPPPHQPWGHPREYREPGRTDAGLVGGDA